MEILHQLGELSLQAVPTVIIVFLFYLFLRSNFFRPLERAMAERHARVEGARAEAAAALAAARENLQVYQEALKKARAEIYAEQEAARRAALEGRAKLLRSARGAAHDRVRSAKERVACELAEARVELEKQGPALATEIARMILGRRPSPPWGGAR